jgi:hypothetical protein
MKVYAPLVHKMLARLILLIGVLFMPLGMTPATAAAHEHAMSGMPMGHCDDGSTKHHAKGGIAECTMACAAALPAADTPNDDIAPIGRMPIRPEASQVLHGLHPDTATPPPKLS